MSMIDVCEHEIIVVSFFLVNSASPILSISKNSIDGALLAILILHISKRHNGKG